MLPLGLVRPCQLVWQIDDANWGELLMLSIISTEKINLDHGGVFYSVQFYNPGVRC